ncbi:MAG: hypothetical protein CMJ48_00965 [Planctomycetaceae bacterium]|nr:hypothetical protein [Planctomycetaceae bacterium]
MHGSIASVKCGCNGRSKWMKIVEEPAAPPDVGRFYTELSDKSDENRLFDELMSAEDAEPRKVRPRRIPKDKSKTPPGQDASQPAPETARDSNKPGQTTDSPEMRSPPESTVPEETALEAPPPETSVAEPAPSSTAETRGEKPEAKRQETASKGKRPRRGRRGRGRRRRGQSGSSQTSAGGEGADKPTTDEKRPPRAGGAKPKPNPGEGRKKNSDGGNPGAGPE